MFCIPKKKSEENKVSKLKEHLNIRVKLNTFFLNNLINKKLLRCANLGHGSL